MSGSTKIFSFMALGGQTPIQMIYRKSAMQTPEDIYINFSLDLNGNLAINTSDNSITGVVIAKLAASGNFSVLTIPCKFVIIIQYVNGVAYVYDQRGTLIFSVSTPLPITKLRDIVNFKTNCSHNLMLLNSNDQPIVLIKLSWNYSIIMILNYLTSGLLNIPTDVVFNIDKCSMPCKPYRCQPCFSCCGIKLYDASTNTVSLGNLSFYVNNTQIDVSYNNLGPNHYQFTFSYYNLNINQITTLLIIDNQYQNLLYDVLVYACADNSSFIYQLGNSMVNQYIVFNAAGNILYTSTLPLNKVDYQPANNTMCFSYDSECGPMPLNAYNSTCQTSNVVNSTSSSLPPCLQKSKCCLKHSETDESFNYSSPDPVCVISIPMNLSVITV